jgi:DNA-binding transcriptional LysR family regulator
MELRRLRLIHELARRGTIAAVADALAYSPSSVSVQLAELEREAGVKLLRRVGRNVALTAAGLRLAEHAEAALTRDEAIRAELAMLGAGPRGHVRLTFVQSPALALLSATLVRLAEAAPDLRAEVVQQETAPAIEALRSRAVDVVVGIEYDPVPVPRHRDVDRRDLIREEVMLAVPLGSARTTLADVEHEPWAAGQPGSGQAAAVENVCNRLGGYAPDIRHRSDDGLILRALVSSGQAVTLLPALIAAATPGVAAHRIPGLYRTIFTATRTAAAEAPAVVAVREAIETAAHAAAAGRDDIRVAQESAKRRRPSASSERVTSP